MNMWLCLSSPRPGGCCHGSLTVAGGRSKKPTGKFVRPRLGGGRAAGGDGAAAAGRLRLGHIPAGSTDAVAYSLNGTRSQETSALHIALGDRCGAAWGPAAFPAAFDLASLKPSSHFRFDDLTGQAFER